MKILYPELIPATSQVKEIATKVAELVTDEIIKTHVAQRFWEYRYYYHRATDNPTEDFIRDFNIASKLRNMNTAMLLYAYEQEYNPIENYDLKDESYHGEKHNDTTVETENSTTTDETNSNQGSYGNTTKQSTYDAGEKTTDKLENSHSDTTQVDSTVGSEGSSTSSRGNASQNVAFDGNDTANYHDVTKDERHAHGNIGVASAPDQIGKENLIRYDNIIYKVIDSICEDLMTIVDTGE